MLVHGQWYLFVIAIDHGIPGGIDLQNPFGDHESQVFFLLNQFGTVIRIYIQYKCIGLIQGINCSIQISFTPKFLGGLTKFQCRIQGTLCLFPLLLVKGVGTPIGFGGGGCLVFYILDILRIHPNEKTCRFHVIMITDGLYTDWNAPNNENHNQQECHISAHRHSHEQPPFDVGIH